MILSNHVGGTGRALAHRPVPGPNRFVLVAAGALHGAEL